MSIQQGLCNCEGYLYAAWKGEVGDERLFYSVFGLRSGQWAPQATVGGNSSVGPSLAVLNNTIIAAWKGEHSDERLFFAVAAPDGAGAISWTPQALIPGVASSTGPSLAAYAGKMFAAWKGSGNDQSLWWATFDGKSWSGQQQIPGVASSVGPSLSSFGGKLYAAWKGSANDERLWYASFDGSLWSGQQQIPGVASSVGPSLSSFGGKLYAAWKGSANDERLWYASFDGSLWSGQQQIPGVLSSIGPALVDFNSELYAMWKGSNGDQRLWYASFDGSNWSGQANVPGNTGQDLPLNIGLRMQFQESSEWCWIAVATSINHFYNPSSTATQCAIMTTIGHNINGFPSNTSACPSAAAIASVPGLAAILADPYDKSSEFVLDNPVLGIPREYLKSGGVGDALNVHGNWNKSGGSALSLSVAASEIAARRPIAVDIAWKGGGQHCVAIAGVLDDWLLICDPIYGTTVIQYESFPSGYQGGASVVSVCLTKAGT